jgi:hypothetical protein
MLTSSSASIGLPNSCSTADFKRGGVRLAFESRHCAWREFLYP